MTGEDIYRAMSEVEESFLNEMLSEDLNRICKGNKERNHFVKKQRGYGLFRKRSIVFIAVAVMIFGSFMYAKEVDWDIKMAEMLGLSSVMQEMGGGYVRIDESEKGEEVCVTATQAIGDQNSQWIQIDTDLHWQVGEGGYYLFDDVDLSITKKENSGRRKDNGCTIYSFNHNGLVSFIFYIENCKKINRSYVDMKLTGIRQYQTADDEEGKQICSGCWNLKWKNSYVGNSITIHPFQWVSVKAEDGTDFHCLIHKLEITPVSLRIEGWKNPKEGKTETGFLTVDSVTMKDGTVIVVDGFASGGNHDNLFVDAFLSFESIEGLKDLNLQDIDSVTVGGEKISVQ